MPDAQPTLHPQTLLEGGASPLSGKQTPECEVQTVSVVFFHETAGGRQFEAVAACAMTHKDFETGCDSSAWTE